jgi:hypothetical protein
VRCSAGLGGVDLYTATRHHFAWYAWNVLELDPADIGQHFGHQDGGELVRKLYGHFDQARARDRIRTAFDSAPTSMRLMGSRRRDGRAQTKVRPGRAAQPETLPRPVGQLVGMPR